MLVAFLRGRGGVVSLISTVPPASINSDNSSVKPPVRAASPPSASWSTALSAPPWVPARPSYTRTLLVLLRGCEGGAREARRVPACRRV